MALRQTAALSIVLAALCPAPAMAASLDGSWQAQCGPGETPGERACAVLAAQRIGDDPAAFVQILVSPTGSDAFTILVRPSDGTAAACDMRIDGAAPVRSDSVLAGVCLFRDSDGALAGRLRRGTALSLTVRSADGREHAATFPLAGFARAIDAVRP